MDDLLEEINSLYDEDIISRVEAYRLTKKLQALVWVVEAEFDLK